MGCCWSSEDEEIERRRNENARRIVRPAYFERPARMESSFDSSYPPWIDRHISDNVVRNHISPVQIRREALSVKRVVVVKPPQIKPQIEEKPGPLYGEFNCSCGYRWRSLLSWRGRYQICKRCKTAVRPKNQREVLLSDYSRDKEDVGDHPQELCEQCIQLGHQCGKVK